MSTFITNEGNNPSLSSHTKKEETTVLPQKDLQLKEHEIISEITKHYALVKARGQGSYAGVLEGYAHNDRSKRHVALKLYYTPSCISALTELSFLQWVQHPYIVKINRILTIRAQVVASLELCDCTLLEYYDLVRSEEVLITTCHQVLSVLAFMHERGFVHGDLSATNILMKDGEVRVADFGAVKRVGANVPYGITTLMYRAPENLLYHSINPSIDLWAFGVILYYLLYGRYYVSSKVEEKGQALTYILHRKQTIFSALNERKEGPEHYPPLSSFYAREQDWRGLLAQCLKWDPTERCTARQALQSPLFSEMNALTVKKKMHGTWVREQGTLDPFLRSCVNDLSGHSVQYNLLYGEIMSKVFLALKNYEAGLRYLRAVDYVVRVLLSEEFAQSPSEALLEEVAEVAELLHYHF